MPCGECCPTRRHLGRTAEAMMETKAWAINGPLQHGEDRSITVRHEHIPLPDPALVRTATAAFQAGHAGSIPVTRSTAKVLVSNWSPLRGASGWPEDLAVGCGWLGGGPGGVAGRRIVVFVAVVAVASVVPVSLLVSMVRRAPREPWIVAFEHERQTSDFPWPSPRRTLSRVAALTKGVDHGSHSRRCAGMDMSKRDAKVCVRVAGAGRRRTVETVTTWGSTTNQILALREHLSRRAGHLVVMEATGDYWKPFYYLLEDAGFEVMLVNARQVKNLPGRKSDVSDAAWLAQLGAHGLVRGSFVPPAPIRELRDLTRTRTAMTRERGSGDPTVGEAARGRRHQAVLGGLRHHRRLRPADAGGPDRRATRPGRAGRPGETHGCGQDPGPDRGADRPVQRPSRVPGPDASGPDRPAHPGHHASSPTGSRW